MPKKLSHALKSRKTTCFRVFTSLKEKKMCFHHIISSFSIYSLLYYFQSVAYDLLQSLSPLIWAVSHVATYTVNAALMLLHILQNRRLVGHSMKLIF